MVLGINIIVIRLGWYISLELKGDIGIESLPEAKAHHMVTPMLEAKRIVTINGIAYDGAKHIPEIWIAAMLYGAIQTERCFMIMCASDGAAFRTVTTILTGREENRFLQSHQSIYHFKG